MLDKRITSDFEPYTYWDQRIFNIFSTSQKGIIFPYWVSEKKEKNTGMSFNNILK